MILLKSPNPWLSAGVQPHCFVVSLCICLSQCVQESREMGMGRRHVWGGGDVSSLTSILPPAQQCVGSLCKSLVITPPPARVCWA